MSVLVRTVTYLKIKTELSYLRLLQQITLHYYIFDSRQGSNQCYKVHCSNICINGEKKGTNHNHGSFQTGYLYCKCCKCDQDLPSTIRFCEENQLQHLSDLIACTYLRYHQLHCWRFCCCWYVIGWRFCCGIYHLQMKIKIKNIIQEIHRKIIQFNF